MNVGECYYQVVLSDGRKYYFTHYDNVRNFVVVYGGEIFKIERIM